MSLDNPRGSAYRPAWSMAVGFTAVMLAAVVVYMIGIAALLGIPATSAARSTSDASDAA